MEIRFAHPKRTPTQCLVLLTIWTLVALPVAAAAADFVRSGTYTGDGSSSFSVTGIGFQPDVVIVKAENNKRSIIRTSDMPDGLSKKLDDNRALENDRIESFQADGFTVGTHDEVNDDGVLYYWVAMKAEDGKLDVGTYVGNGNSLRTVSVQNMYPRSSLIMPAENDLSVYHANEMEAYETYGFDGSGRIDSAIGWHFFNSITVGNSKSVNEDGKDYYFIAWKEMPDEIQSGTFFGNGNDVTTFADLDMDPEYMMIFNDNYALPIHRPQSLTGDASLFFIGSPVQNNLIQSMDGGELVLGDDDSVNEEDTQYFWFALANPENTADLRVQLSLDDTTPDEGQTIHLSVALSNLGPSEATGIQITDLLPAGLTFQSANPDQGTYDEGTGIWDVGTAINGQSWNLNLTATVDAGTGGTTLVHTASVTAADQSDPDTSNNAASQNITVSAPAGADLELALLVDDPTPEEGDTVVFSLTVTNNGPTDANNIEITTDLPVALAITGDNPEDGNFNQGSQIWSIPALNIGQSSTLEIQALVGTGTSGQTVNSSATVTALDEVDPNNGNSTASVDLLVSTIDLQITLNADSATPAEGAAVLFTLVATNLGETP